MTYQEKTCEFIEAKCLHVARRVKGCEHLTAVKIVPNDPGLTNWRVEKFIPDDLAFDVATEARSAILREVNAKYALTTTRRRDRHPAFADSGEFYIVERPVRLFDLPGPSPTPLGQPDRPNAKQAADALGAPCLIRSSCHWTGFVPIAAAMAATFLRCSSIAAANSAGELLLATIPIGSRRSRTAGVSATARTSPAIRSRSSDGISRQPKNPITPSKARAG